jgi:hypothetical protein
MRSDGLDGDRAEHQERQVSRLTCCSGPGDHSRIPHASASSSRLSTGASSPGPGSAWIRLLATSRPTSRRSRFSSAFSASSSARGTLTVSDASALTRASPRLGALRCCCAWLLSRGGASSQYVAGQRARIRTRAGQCPQERPGRPAASAAGQLPMCPCIALPMAASAVTDRGWPVTAKLQAKKPWSSQYSAAAILGLAST